MQKKPKGKPEEPLQETQPQYEDGAEPGHGLGLAISRRLARLLH